MPLPNSKLVKGNAYIDGAPEGGWFVAGFIEVAFGLRCRRDKHVPCSGSPADFELKMLRHLSGDKEKDLFPFNKTATSLSMLIGSGRFELFFCSDKEWDHVTLEKDGDYALWAPGVGHRWLAYEPSTIFTVRVPGVRGDQALSPLDQVPGELLRYFDEKETALA